ncbi:uncharacterized protein LOC142336773 [Convolutriloba macropyga]|uniref:uncharacterized protein LOC142336773 n=1 Tax=Convolutriloba macropyga TaxID=536237 RepID=UPI003F525A24
MSDKENVSKQSKEGEGGEKKEGGNKLTAQNVFLTSLAMKKQYFMSRMINWHPNMKVELAKEKMTNFNYGLFKANDKDWNENCTLFLDTYQLLFKESKLDHLIIVITIDKCEREVVAKTKRALDRIFSTIPMDPSVLILFTGDSVAKLDSSKPGAEFSIYHHRQTNTNTMHCHKIPEEISIDNVNSALFWTLHKHLRKICGVDPQTTDEMAPFYNSEAMLDFGKDYIIDVVSHDF